MSIYHMSYRKCHAADIMRVKVFNFLYAMFGDNLIVWDGKKEFIWKGEPLKIKITLRNGGEPIIVTEKKAVTFDKKGNLTWG